MKHQINMWHSPQITTPQQERKRRVRWCYGYCNSLKNNTRVTTRHQEGKDVKIAIPIV